MLLPMDMEILLEEGSVRNSLPVKKRKAGRWLQLCLTFPNRIGVHPFCAFTTLLQKKFREVDFSFLVFVAQEGTIK